MFSLPLARPLNEPNRINSLTLRILAQPYYRRRTNGDASCLIGYLQHVINDYELVWLIAPICFLPSLPPWARERRRSHLHATISGPKFFLTIEMLVKCQTLEGSLLQICFSTQIYYRAAQNPCLCAATLSV
jgi:hypothetical protein